MIADRVRMIYKGNIPSYMILTDDRRIDFEIENTPIANFFTYNPFMIINDVSYTKSAIKELHFESSYNGVTEIGDGFLSNCTSLTNVTLDFPALNSVSGHFLSNCTSLTNVTLDFPALNSVSNAFLTNCTSLTNVTLDFPALNSVNSYFLNECTSLTDITLTAETPPITNPRNFLSETSNLSSIYVPANSVNLYKTTVPWSSKSNLIKAI